MRAVSPSPPRCAPCMYLMNVLCEGLPWHRSRETEVKPPLTPLLAYVTVLSLGCASERGRLKPGQGQGRPWHTWKFGKPGIVLFCSLLSWREHWRKAYFLQGCSKGVFALFLPLISRKA